MLKYAKKRIRVSDMNMLRERAIITLLVSILLFTCYSATIAALGTTMQVKPSAATAKMGQAFSINITMDQVAGLTAWEFTIYYSNALLKCIDAAEGPFLNSSGDTYFLKYLTDVYNATHGRLMVGCTLLGMVPGVSGSGVLATVTFKAKALGDITIHLANTELTDVNIPPKPIPHSTTDGTVHVELMTGHDVGVADIVSSKTVICKGCAASFNVTVQNQGQYSETFSVTLYANTTQIKTQAVTLTSGNSATIAAVWTNIDVSLGNYTLRAEAPLQTDVDPADNILTDGTIRVSIKGDINADGKVNILDVAAAAKAFGSKPGSQNWNPNADLNEDRQINILDIAAIAREFGKTQ
jgi:hypothetical protein